MSFNNINTLEEYYNKKNLKLQSCKNAYSDVILNY